MEGIQGQRSLGGPTPRPSSGDRFGLGDVEDIPLHPDIGQPPSCSLGGPRWSGGGAHALKFYKCTLWVLGLPLGGGSTVGADPVTGHGPLHDHLP